MRSIDPALQAELDGGATTLCACWRVTRVDGVALGFTDHDRPLAFDGTLFDPDGGADGAALVAGADLAIDNAEIAGAFASDRVTAADLAAGRYDDATVEMWRVDWRDPSRRLRLAVATIGETTREDGRFRAELRGLGHQLGRTVGRVYQRDCDAVVGDARCGVDLGAAAHRGEGVVVAALDELGFEASGLAPFEDGWFVHGVVAWQSGANAGTQAHVKGHRRLAGGAARVDLWLPAGGPIAAGDAFTVAAGCRRDAETCAGKFANLVNFRGFHLMPGNDVAVSYPVRADDNDGGRR
ncbi:MAG: DUF2163 domain-containing protein [Alphaproteobacteria bacterium]|nr:DUF2163 domain-containing protein [Alphaproteobacteria bacterium]